MINVKRKLNLWLSVVTTAAFFTNPNVSAVEETPAQRDAWVEWSFKIDRPGRFGIWADLALEKGPSRFQIGLPQKQAPTEVAATGNFYKFVKTRVGAIIIDQAGDYTLQMNPESDHWQPINVRELVLKPE